MRAIVAAYHNMGCVGLDALLRAGFEVVATFTYPDDAREAIWFDSVAERASRYGIPVYSPDNINHPMWVEKIRAVQPDILFSFYYRDLIREPILEIPRAGCLNLHGSLLPKYRGRSPINWVLVNGESETGVTLHHMTPRPDDGDIVCQRAVSIELGDNVLTLSGKMTAAARAMLDEILPAVLEGKAPRTPQDHAKASYYSRRRPEDGAIDWCKPATKIANLVRAVTQPYPGAFTYRAQTKVIVWEANLAPSAVPSEDHFPGTVLSTRPLQVASGNGVLEVCFGQIEGGVYQSGADLARELNLVPGLRLGPLSASPRPGLRKTRVLILGVNGFIGNALTERLLETGRYEVHGMDLNNNAIERFGDITDFYFHEGDISIHREWIEYHVKKCDVVIPLIAIATPREYTQNPLRVFELDFEENLRIVRYCAKYGKRIVFPSTSEVYGMCADPLFDEDRSRLVLGPIRKQRWIYSCSKQLLDRVIWAYGKMEGLRFTLFRPFNWIGPRLDTLDSARIGSSRAITQLIVNLVDGTPIQLIDGGMQKRCFTDVEDGIECLYRVIENCNNICDGKIINIGNPDGEVSIRELAEMLHDQFEVHPTRHYFPPFAGMRIIESHKYYGDGYEDVQYRRPSIEIAKRLLGWSPKIPLETSVAKTIDYFLREHASVDEGAKNFQIQPLDRHFQ